ncbi:uncharacterized protein LOC129587329 [Paramacrobiotus metropolitanus]|uniref:uncharacterized protein LOC129587329 n=1 Tax=Paramacrobiotus metropolitanus TaxID=2943436 RepID=UPI002446333B|nr:uncharacterized protein LOC129587329 [Paramacrobiotus metropolitanus]
MLWRVGSQSGGPWLVRWRSVGRSPFAVAHAQPSAWESAVQLQSARTLAVSALYPTFLRGNDFPSSSARCLSTWTSGDPRSASFRSSENGHGSSLMISPWGRWLHQPAAGFLGHSSVYALHNAVLHHQRRFLHVSPRRWEAAEEKSKVERTVEALKKDKQSKERVLQPPAVAGGSGGDSAVAAARTEEKALAAPSKKTLWQKEGAIGKKLEMAKFLQETIHETALEHQDQQKSTRAAEFAAFFDRIKGTGEEASTAEIMKFAKLFEDDLTLDNLPREVVVAMCRLLDIGTYGLPPEFLRFQLRMRLRNLRSDDKMIQREGIDKLDDEELQAACRARGMRSIGVSRQRLQAQLAQWIDLSLREEIPPSLLLLTRAMYLPDNLTTQEQLKTTLAQMPEKLGGEVEVKIAEEEGAKPDYEVKLRLVREEQEGIKREEAERKERETKEKSADATEPKKEEQEGIKREEAERKERETKEKSADATEPKKDTMRTKETSGIGWQSGAGPLPVMFSRSAATLASQSPSHSDSALERIRWHFAGLFESWENSAGGIADNEMLLPGILEAMIWEDPERDKRVDVGAVQSLLQHGRPLWLPPADGSKLMAGCVLFLRKKHSRWSILSHTLTAPNDLSEDARRTVAAARDLEALEMLNVGVLTTNLLYQELRTRYSPQEVLRLLGHVTAERCAMAPNLCDEADTAALAVDVIMQLIAIAGDADGRNSHESKLAEDMKNAEYLLRSGVVGIEAQLVLGHCDDYDWADAVDSGGGRGGVVVHWGWVYYTLRITPVHSTAVGSLTTRVLRALGDSFDGRGPVSLELVDRHGCGRNHPKICDSIIVAVSPGKPRVNRPEVAVVESSFTNENCAVLFIESANWLGRATHAQYCFAVKIAESTNYFHGYLWVFKKTSAPIGKSGPGRGGCARLASTPTGKKEGRYNVYAVNGRSVTALSCEFMGREEILNIFDMHLIGKFELNPDTLNAPITFPMDVVLPSGEKKVYSVNLAGYCEEVFNSWLKYIGEI